MLRPASSVRNAANSKDSLSTAKTPGAGIKHSSTLNSKTPFRSILAPKTPHVNSPGVFPKKTAPNKTTPGLSKSTAKPITSALAKPVLRAFRDVTNQTPTSTTKVNKVATLNGKKGLSTADTTKTDLRKQLLHKKLDEAKSAKKELTGKALKISESTNLEKVGYKKAETKLVDDMSEFVDREVEYMPPTIEYDEPCQYASEFDFNFEELVKIRRPLELPRKPQKYPEPDFAPIKFELKNPFDEEGDDFTPYGMALTTDDLIDTGDISVPYFDDVSY
ncbi:hypothetical protein BKA69DRAFT_1087716 [Paraphysoderma sedebokerense]|nr:hypothetical protein BKA69DRAFT_1087716 [Paraphysoderma sedebokerense]